MEAGGIDREEAGGADPAIQWRVASSGGWRRRSIGEGEQWRPAAGQMDNRWMGEAIRMRFVERFTGLIGSSYAKPETNGGATCGDGRVFFFSQEGLGRRKG